MTTTEAPKIRSWNHDGTVTYYGTLVSIDNHADTCPMCGKVARKLAIIREVDGSTVRAAGKCARHLLGYDPFKKASK